MEGASEAGLPPPGEEGSSSYDSYYYYYYEEEAEAEGWGWGAWGNGSPPVGRCAGELSAPGATDWEASFWLLPALYLLAFGLGLAGNGLVLATLWRAPSGRRRAADPYLAHLALADLAFVGTLPLWAAYTALRFHWPFGAALCKLSSYLGLLAMFASAFCLAALSLERALALDPRRPPRRAPRPAPRARPAPCARPAPALAAAWLLAALLALPALLLRDTRRRGPPAAARLECDLDLAPLAGGSPRAQGYWLAALSLATAALGFAGPLLLMGLCYWRLGAAVRRHFPPGGPGRRRLLRILVGLVGAFGACWLPFHALKGLYVLAWLGLLRPPCAALALLLRLQPFAACLAYLNSCLNPALYAFLDPRFRARARRLLRPPAPSPGRADGRAGGRAGGRGAAGGPGAGGAGSLSSTLSGQTQKSEAPSLATKL